MTESAITFPLLDPGKAHYCCMGNAVFHFTRSNQHEYTEGLKCFDNQGHFIISR